MSTQKVQKPTLRTEVYERLKLWDKKRAQILKSHKKAVEQIFETIEKKMEKSKEFLYSVKIMLQERVNQLKIYCQQSVIDSDLVFSKNANQSLASHHELLKQLYIVQANITAQESVKYTKLTALLQNLNLIVDQNDSQDNANLNDQSSLIASSMKSSIKYLIEVQLAQAIESVTLLAETVSKIYNENLQKDLYLAIDEFLRMARNQTNKHRQLGKQILSLIAASIKQQISAQDQIKRCIKQWSQIDGPIDTVFVEQLMKNNSLNIVKDFYEISDMTNINYEQQQISLFLTDFKIDDFVDHEKLKLCEVEGFYNSKIQTRILITVDCYMHLIRITSHEPDFSFVLNPELCVKKIKQCNLQLTQYKKKFYFKKQKQFQFTLELNTEEDLHHMKMIIQKISFCKVQ